MQYDYQVHDLGVSVRCPRGPLPGVPWLIQKLDAFRIADSSEHSHPPAIVIEIGPFTCDTTRWRNVDHRYWARPNEIYFVGRWNKVSYRTHWAGLEPSHQGPIHVKLDITLKGVMRFPWLMQADWIMHMYVLKPLMELIWARRNRFVMHAAGVARQGQAALFTGYGSSLKTSFAMQLIRQGWQFLGDDQVLLTESGVLPLAVSLRTFDFRTHHLPTEYLTPVRLARLGWHLLRKRPPRIELADSSTIRAMNLLVRSTKAQAQAQAILPEHAARRVVTNCRAETIQSVRDSPPIHQPLLAYQLMYPAFDHDHYWPAFERLLSEQLQHAVVREIELTQVWDDAFMDVVALPDERNPT